MNGEGQYYVTVESFHAGYALYWEGWADSPTDALQKAQEAREEEIQDDPHPNG